MLSKILLIIAVGLIAYRIYRFFANKSEDKRPYWEEQAMFYVYNNGQGNVKGFSRDQFQLRLMLIHDEFHKNKKGWFCIELNNGDKLYAPYYANDLEGVKFMNYLQYWIVLAKLIPTTKVMGSPEHFEEVYFHYCDEVIRNTPTQEQRGENKNHPTDE